MRPSQQTAENVTPKMVAAQPINTARRCQTIFYINLNWIVRGKPSANERQNDDEQKHQTARQGAAVANEALQDDADRAIFTHNEFLGQ